MIAAVMQPTYLPWLGYFDLMDQVDVFVMLDDVELSHQSWQQRNRVKGPAGLQWLTVPVRVKGRSRQTIRDAEISDPGFARKHLRTLEVHYGRAAHFSESFGELRELLGSRAWRSLAELNTKTLDWLRRRLGISTRVVSASDLEVSGARTERLVEICQRLGATTYVSPPGAAEYLKADRACFEGSEVELRFHHYEHPEYTQQYPPFAPYASALDALFNEGQQTLAVIRRGRRPTRAADEVFV